MSLKLNLKASSIPVKLESNGGCEDYELREMTAAARDSYLDVTSNRIKMDAAGKPSGVTKFEGLQAELVSRCLFRKDGKSVSRDIIQNWPSSVVNALFEECQKLNHLNRTEKEVLAEAKNE